MFTDIRRSSRPFLEGKSDDDFFQIDVSVISYVFSLQRMLQMCSYSVVGYSAAVLTE